MLVGLWVEAGCNSDSEQEEDEEERNDEVFHGESGLQANGCWGIFMVVGGVVSCVGMEVGNEHLGGCRVA